MSVLLRWYKAYGRYLPWREGQEPYHIWVIETLLQQTRIAQAQGRIARFFERFPTLEALAEAPIEAVLAVWQGLGYYQRAHNLHRAARQLHWLGGWEAVRASPDPLKLLESLPGIGPYTARAILSFTGWRGFLPVDGNVLRVLSRLWGIASNDRALYQEKADALPSSWKKREVAYAFMDLAQLICTPRRPKCLFCPLASECKALHAGTPEAFPPRRLPREKPIRYFLLSLCENSIGVWLERRPLRGLWGGLWSLPIHEVSEQSPRKPDILHELKHFRFVGYIEVQKEPPPATKLIPWSELTSYALPAPILRLLMQEAEAHGISISVQDS
ncbi:MAG: A/G-specific adenine glycosylase [Bacteroidia bacterium]|nr:A/G-specific adenine glycosylase [Bacteroidia bacterium]